MRRTGMGPRSSEGSINSGIGLRRNGKQSACEPCRKGKLACDHGAPHCGRCVRRNMTAKCVYHPAPMTRPRPIAAMSSPDTPSTGSGSSHALSPSQNLEPIMTPFRDNSHSTSGFGDNKLPSIGSLDVGIANLSGRNSSSSVPPLEGRLDFDIDQRFRRSARFYGPTSFSAVFDENVTLSEDLDIGEDGRSHPSSRPLGQPLLGRDRPSAPNVRMNQIVTALWNMPSEDICQRLLETLWSTFGAELATPRSSEKLTRIAEVLFKNEQTSLPPSPEDPYAWMDGFTGPNLRFEMLGMLFAYFGMSYQILQDWDQLFLVPENHGRDRKQTTWRMKECADICLKMCEFSEENNEISIALMMCVAVLETVCIGDESFQTRRRIADIMVCAIAAGLHRQADYGPDHKPTLAWEYKRRLFTIIYSGDKNHAALNGTPPALSKRFCIVRLPLDLSEEELFYPPEDLQKCISRLDENGWNTDGRTHRITFLRGLKLITDVREDILDTALSVDAHVPQSRVDELHRRCQDSYDDLPEQLHYYAYDNTPKVLSNADEMLCQGYIFLNQLQNRFLIDRVAIARGFPNEQRLLNTALEMMDLTTMFWIKRDQLIGFSSAFDWIITCFGVPSAGVLCVELLKQSCGQSVLELSRSDAIQKLTMFIGFLEWIRPTDGNYMLAGRLKKTVRRILDRVLDPPKDIPGATMMDFQIDPTLGEIDWLNTIDWTQGSWVELN